MANEMTAPHGVVCWSELAVRDIARAQKFYAETLGWRFEAMAAPDMTYWIIFSGEARVGGMFEMKGAQFDGVPEHWLTYIAVDDIDARLKKAVEAGAKTCKEPFDIPGVGRMAVLAEPGGAVVAWIRLEQ
ncbi:VOC family protein [Methylocystis sp. JR02]|uniref:VOC family protein n=1 Tax=Methylocystis sp. JR02 TaxID=3046284 RepID=UPI0024BA8BCC|nr:VOC family protein [Methylocystis sp. JR02]MDJ0449491.1 VOC family protein [Methylocystis sp. JR02]